MEGGELLVFQQRDEIRSHLYRERVGWQRRTVVYSYRSFRSLSVHSKNSIVCLG